LGIVTRRSRESACDASGGNSDGYNEPRDIYVVGVSHRSLRSADHARAVIEELRPDAVVLEVCRSRTGLLYPQTSALPSNPFLLVASALSAALRRGDVSPLIQAMLVAAMQRAGRQAAESITDGENAQVLEPGTEFRAAMKAARDVGATVVLGDRPIECTVRRTLQALTLWERWLCAAAFVRIIVFGDLSTASLRDSKLRRVIERGSEDETTAGVVASYLKHFTDKFPQVMRPLVQERDMYLAWSLKRSKAVEGARVVVGVVGLGHVQGICESIDADNGRRREGATPFLRFRDLVR
jgi:pheromone shutdown protein TraB